MEKWHAAKPNSIVNGAPAPKPVPVKESDSPEAIAPERLEKPPAAGAPPQYTQVFADAIVAEAERDERVIGITAAMAGGTGLQKLADELPEQYYDVGIAEQNAVLLASGLALQGAKPVCAIYSTFLQRAYDQIIHDVCLQELDVTFAMDRAGLVGDDGPTHHGAFDISYFRPLPNVVVMAPRDEAMLVHMLRTAIAHDGPAALRYPRGAAEGVDAARPSRRRSRSAPASCWRAASGWRCSATATASRSRCEAAEILAGHDLKPTVADARFAKPLDAELLERLALEPRPGGDDRGERAARRLRLGRARAPRGRLRRPARRAGAGAAGRPARPLRHPRQAGAAARGGRPDRRVGGRAGARRAALRRARPQLSLNSKRSIALVFRASLQVHGRGCISVYVGPRRQRISLTARSSAGLSRRTAQLSLGEACVDLAVTVLFSARPADRVSARKLRRSRKRMHGVRSSSG